ncbi:MAG: regulatory protein RecX [Thiolinea sp.]
MTESQRAEAYQYAIRLLARREHSRRELALKITHKFAITTAVLDELLEGLAESGYQDDQRYAGMLVRSAVARGQGPMKIVHALRDKGVDEELAKELLADYAGHWLQQACQQRAKKFGEEIPTDFKQRARQSRFLAGRGFSIDTINAVFHEKC